MIRNGIPCNHLRVFRLIIGHYIVNRHNRNTFRWRAGDHQSRQNQRLIASAIESRLASYWPNRDGYAPDGWESQTTGSLLSQDIQLNALAFGVTALLAPMTFESVAKPVLSS